MAIRSKLHRNLAPDRLRDLKVSLRFYSLVPAAVPGLIGSASPRAKINPRQRSSESCHRQFSP